MAAKDPRKPRPNPEIPALLRCIKKTHEDLQTASSFAQRRGHARVLAAHLRMLDDEPETLTDLMPGTCDWKPEIGVEVIGDFVELREETLFEQPGPCHELYFFQTGSALSLLHEPPLTDPYRIPTLQKFGFLVNALEKLYASSTPTSHHFTSEQALRQYVPARRAAKESPYWLLCDPQGVADGKTRVVNRYATLKGAIKAADKLSEKFDIRFLVARFHLNANFR